MALSSSRHSRARGNPGLLRQVRLDTRWSLPSTLIGGGYDGSKRSSSFLSSAPVFSKERIDTLRKAFAATLKDPDFLTEAKKGGLEVNPLGGDEVKKVVDDLFALNPTIVAKLSSILTVKQ